MRLSIGISYIVSPRNCNKLRDCFGPKRFKLSLMYLAAFLSFITELVERKSLININIFSHKPFSNNLRFVTISSVILFFLLKPVWELKIFRIFLFRLFCLVQSSYCIGNGFVFINFVTALSGPDLC
jgi:hypothetical protein